MCTCSNIKLTHYCLTATIVTVSSKFRFQKKKGYRKKFLWAPRLWVGRRWEPILGYISKFDGIKVSGINGLKKMIFFLTFMTHYCLTATIVTVLSKFRFKNKKGSKKNFLWAPRLWVGRRWSILGYISKFGGIKVSGINGLRDFIYQTLPQSHMRFNKWIFLFLSKTYLSTQLLQI